MYSDVKCIYYQVRHRYAQVCRYSGKVHVCRVVWYRYSQVRYRCAQVCGTGTHRCVVQTPMCVARTPSESGFGQWRPREGWGMVNVVGVWRSFRAGAGAVGTQPGSLEGKRGKGPWGFGGRYLQDAEQGCPPVSER